MHSFLLDEYLGVKFLDGIIGSKSCQMVYKGVNCCTIPSAVDKCLDGHFGGRVVVSYRGLILHFPDDLWRWVSLHMLFAIRISSLMKCAFRSLAHFLDSFLNWSSWHTMFQVDSRVVGRVSTVLTTHHYDTIDSVSDEPFIPVAYSFRAGGLYRPLPFTLFAHPPPHWPPSVLCIYGSVCAICLFLHLFFLPSTCK